MAFMVLFSTLSFNVSKHYCAGEIASVSYFLQADGCATEIVEPTCDPEKETQVHIEKKSCCDTENDFVDGSDFLKDETKAVATTLHFCSIKLPFDNLVSSVEYISKEETFKLYHPPLVLKDITVLYETFLI